MVKTFLLAGLLLTGCAHVRPELAKENAPVSAPVHEIQVSAVKWHFEPKHIQVKQGEKVRLVFTSNDVVHGIEIPALGIKKALPPYQPVTVEFYAAKAGKIRFECSHWCGLGHVFMLGRIDVQP